MSNLTLSRSFKHAMSLTYVCTYFQLYILVVLKVYVIIVPCYRL